MDGTLTFEEGTDVGGLMRLFSLNRAGLYGHASQRLLRRVWRAARRWHQANPIGVAAVIHCIGSMTPPGTTGPFIRKYIFPGVYTPSLSEVFAATERVGLWVADTEVLRRHYDYTLQHWRNRFAANRTQAVAIAGERFCRMWEYYLAAVQVGFRNGSNMVFQLLLSNRIDSVPIARDSMMVGAKTAGTPNRRAAASDGAAMCEIAAKAEKFRQRAVAREAEIKSAS
jgi:hypothetical protein